MEKPNKEIKPSDRSLDKRAVAIGVIGLLGLATICFFLGLFCLGPIMQSHVKVPNETSESSSYVHPPIEAPSPSDSNGQPLDVEITEQGENTSSSSDNGVQQNGNTLNVTLDEGSMSDSTSKPDEENKPEKPTAARETSNSSGKNLYRVQVGTFANESNADVLATSLKDQGYEAQIKTVQVEGKTLYRVQVGEHQIRENAQKMADEISKAGYSPSVVAE